MPSPGAHGVRRGFSLVELLVSLAVITTLIAMIAPALSAARAQAHKLKCATQLRSIGQGFVGFANDHDSLPLAAKLIDVDHATLQLTDRLSPYLGDTPAVNGSRILPPWACPADRIGPPAGTGSYVYSATSFLLDPDVDWDPYLVPTNRQRGRLALLSYEASASALPIMVESDRHHSRRPKTPESFWNGVPSDWQALYFDGSVRDWR